MNLIQDKLDVVSKKRANLFNWRGQFTPEFVEYILESSGLTPNSFIADPFAGSGTVLIESAIQGYSSVGFEINPAAYQMAKFYEYSNLNLSERHDLIFRIQKKLSEILSGLNGKPIYSNTTDYRTSYKGLIEATMKVKQISEDNDISFFMNMLFASEKDTKMTVKSSLSKSFSFLKNALINLPFNQADINIHNSDARKIGTQYANQIDLIITSPPYINVFNYHQNYRAVTESFDYNILNVAHSEFGSNRKNRGNRLLTVIQYCIDMEESLFSFWKSLTESGKIVMVIGRESNVRKTPFYNGKIVMDLIDQMGGFQNLSKHQRSFTNKFGKLIIEDIISIDKDPNAIPEVRNASQVAITHLLKAQNVAPKDVLVNFKDALERVNSVKPSPIFN